MEGGGVRDVSKVAQEVRWAVAGWGEGNRAEHVARNGPPSVAAAPG